jgi:hypothetical protein
MKISAAYANGEFSQSPDGTPSSSVITSQSNDQTLKPKVRAKAKKDQQQAENPKPDPTSTPKPGPTGTPTPDPTTPAFDPETYAANIEALYIKTNGRPIAESCDADPTTWECHYDGITARSESRLYVLLTAPADMTDQQANDMSQQARLAWFTAVGGEFPELDTILTVVNGSKYTGTTSRADVPALNQ